MNFKWLVGFLVLAVLAVGGDWYVSTQIQAQPPQIAGSIGQLFTNYTQFIGGRSDIERIIASSTKASVTMTGSEFQYADELDYTINNAAGDTLTLPASTTPLCASLAKGEQRTLLIRNASTTAETLTLAGSASILLKVSTTTTILGSTDGSGVGVLTILKIPSTNCDALFLSYN